LNQARFSVVNTINKSKGPGCSVLFESQKSGGGGKLKI
jgi:hypothetical protein